ncbi:MAG: hypothetical protein JWP94_2947 [Mucilaginibacter sp.]|nr:hypothetical protein [Mucilaginibacter sp.]
MKNSIKATKSPSDDAFKKDIMIGVLANPKILTELIDVKVIWFAEWEHFTIIQANSMFFLFEKQVIVFRTNSIETVKWELMERHYLYKRNSQQII